MPKAASAIALTPEPRAPAFLPTMADRSRVDAAREAGRRLANRLRNRASGVVRAAPVRIEFIRRGDRLTVPPARNILGAGGGRGGEVRFKLYLSLVWASPGGGHTTEFAGAEWAQLLGLPKYSTTGKRRIYDALDWLVDNRFIEREKTRGTVSELTILHDDGTGTQYSNPTSEALAGTGGRPIYRRLHPDWWRNGWIAVLSGRSLLMWLILLDRTTQAQPTGPIWIAESVTEKEYGVSAHIRQLALRELAEFGLITTSRRFVREAFGSTSSRTFITLHPDRLRELPAFAPA